MEMLCQAQREVQELFHGISEGPTHGYEHAIRVWKHAQAGIAEYVATRQALNPNQQMAIELAALLHDADDSKLFPGTFGTPHATEILKKIGFADLDLVEEMISMVSFSQNGLRGSSGKQTSLVSSLPEGQAKQVPLWMLIPRDADRVEALGEIGLARCVEYGLTMTQRPLFLPETPRCRCREEVWVTGHRYWLNRQHPDSTMDYLMAGLIPRGSMATGLQYFEGLARCRMEPIYEVCLQFGKTGSLTVEDILAHLKDPDARKLLEK